MSGVVRVLAISTMGLAVALGAAAAADVSGQHFEGYAYSASDGKLLYRESHWLDVANGGERRQLVVYRCADGQAFARKRVVETAADTSTPDFDMLDARTGYHAGVRTREGQREVFEKPDEQTPERHAPLKLPQNAAIDAGLYSFIRTHWDAVSNGGVSPVPVLVPSRLDYIDFNARKLRDEQLDGRGVRWFRLSIAMWGLGFALPHIEVGYDALTHELRAYRGLTDIRGEGNKNLNVRIDFPPAERHSNVAPVELDKAAEVSLTGRCLMH